MLLAAGVPVRVAPVLFVLAAIGEVDLVVVVRRTVRGEPG